MKCVVLQEFMKTDHGTGGVVRYSIGQVIDIDDQKAVGLVAQGYVEEASEPKGVPKDGGGKK